MKLSPELIQSLLPDPPDGHLGYSVEQVSHMWWRIQLRHRDYCYKSGVLTDYGYVKSNGEVYAPGHNHKPSKDIVCTITELYKQEPWTLTIPKGGRFSHSLLHLL